MDSVRLDYLRLYPTPIGATECQTLVAEINRLKRGEFTEAEAAELIRFVLARTGATRAQVETACWEWQERTFGPRKTDGTTSLIGTKGDFDGTYPTDQEVVRGGKTERVPGRES